MMTENAQQVLATLLGRMGMDVEVASEEDGERIRLTVRGEDAALLIGKKGQTLDALQFLVNRMVKGDEENHKVIDIDADGYRVRRAESLVELAMRLSEKARETGQVIALNPMSARDRRTIHMTLKDVNGVTTQSEGEGEERRLLIVPK